jgi:hypothetical protein
VRRRPLPLNARKVAALCLVVPCGLLIGVPSSFGTTAAPDGPVGSVPATATPHLVTTAVTEQIRQLAQCGSTMYAVGTFTEIGRNSTKYSRNGAFSFSADAPYKVTAWNPNVDGTVDTIAFNGTDCADAYLGGQFATVGGTALDNIAEVDTTTGSVVSAFKSAAHGKVETIAAWHGHLLTGGAFTSINGSATDPYFTSLNPTTGKNDNYLSLAISGTYAYTDDDGLPADANTTRVYNQQISPDGTRDLIEGDFTDVGGQPRRQIAMINLASARASTDGRYPTQFNQNCQVAQPMYAQGAAWSPDDSTVYVATTGGSPANGEGFLDSQPRAGLCDSASAFSSTPSDVTALWINYTGCNSLFAAAADTNTAYFGGHEQWADNPDGCNTAGPDAIPAAGIVGLSPTNGTVTTDPTRSRGLGADDMLITPAGLWIASDNLNGVQNCGGVSGHAGLCLLRYAPA